MTPPDPLTYIVLAPAGMLVRGQHDPASPAILPLLADDVARRHADWRAKVLARPGGFDGERAVLTGFHHEEGALSLATAYRSYTEGLALRDSLREARADGRIVLDESGDMRPDARMSWGMSLTTYALLPHDYVLCAERDPNLISLPGLWTCSHTEIIEPADIDPVGMQRLLSRLVDEEMPALAGMGDLKFVGLSLRKNSYVWQLVSVIDLRGVGLDVLAPALLALQPDAETVAWSVCALEPAAAQLPNPYPEPLQRPAGTLPVDFDIAQFLNRKVLPC